ncbi:hypothetical protein NPIL_378691 [Nephila pilipes]|uniref:Uncharacterized protein n=1 Tax=Nephila pilipes TaxID=299642 RepID=A0A8X6QSS1_NEPPI|nr:hypothetical protein NPIL_378691 [Nephila pilipes]
MDLHGETGSFSPSINLRYKTSPKSISKHLRKWSLSPKHDLPSESDLGGTHTSHNLIPEHILERSILHNAAPGEQDRFTPGRFERHQHS